MELNNVECWCFISCIWSLALCIICAYSGCGYMLMMMQYAPTTWNLNRKYYRPPFKKKWASRSFIVIDRDALWAVYTYYGDATEVHYAFDLNVLVARDSPYNGLDGLIGVTIRYLYIHKEHKRVACLMIGSSWKLFIYICLACCVLLDWFFYFWMLRFIVGREQ